MLSGVGSNYPARAASAIDFASAAPASRASQQNTSQSRSPSGLPEAKAADSVRYSDARLNQVTSGTPRQCGSSPVAAPTSRDAARATTPFALRNG